MSPSGRGVTREASPQRGFYHHAYRHSTGQPIVAGWAYQWVAHIHLQHDSWTAPMRVRRLEPLENVNRAAGEQSRSLLRHRWPTDGLPMLVFDAGYDPVQLAQALADLCVGLLVRLRAGRCFYQDPDPTPAAATGRLRRQGAKLAGADPSSWGVPTAQYAEPTSAYGAVRVRSWGHVHAQPQNHQQRGTRRPRPVVRGTLILLEVERLPNQTRHPEPMWWWGPSPPDLSQIWRYYLARFTLEHAFGFFKQILGWTTARVRHPAQADRWTRLLLLAYTPLRLARSLVQDQRLPWQKPLPLHHLSPGRVRQGPQMFGWLQFWGIGRQEQEMDMLRHA